jgi:arginine decarboxylase
MEEEGRDPESLWKLKKEVVSTRNVTQTAVGDKNGRWTTAIAAAVMLD